MDIAQGSILGTFPKLRSLRCSELPFEAVEQAVEHKALAFVQWKIRKAHPKARLGEYRRESRLRAFDGAAQAPEEPIHPRCDVRRSLLRLLQDVVIGSPLLLDLRRHAVEALRIVFGPRESHIRNGARDAAVVVVEGGLSG